MTILLLNISSNNALAIKIIQYHLKGNEIMQLTFVKIVTFLLIITLISLGSFSAYTSLSLYKRLHYLSLNPLSLNEVEYTQLQNNDEINGELIAIIGDSRAKQWAFPDTFSEKVINLGISGHTTAQALARNRLILGEIKPSILVLQIGINDLKAITLFPGRTQEIIKSCKNNITALVELAKSIGVKKVVLTSVFPTGKPPFYRKPFWNNDINTAISDVNSHIEGLVSGDVAFLDTHSLLLNITTGLIRNEYQQDFLHITKNGYTALNQKLLPILKSN